MAWSTRTIPYTPRQLRASASMSATKSNAGRRELTSPQLSAGPLTA
jgi:hypothetical protein